MFFLREKQGRLFKSTEIVQLCGRIYSQKQRKSSKDIFTGWAV